MNKHHPFPPCLKKQVRGRMSANNGQDTASRKQRKDTKFPPVSKYTSIFIMCTTYVLYMPTPACYFETNDTTANYRPSRRDR